MTYSAQDEDVLVRRFSQVQSTRTGRKWAAGLLGVAGVFVFPFGILLWVIAGILCYLISRETSKLEEIRHQVNKLRTLRNSESLEGGDLVSLVADPSGIRNNRLIGIVGSYREGSGDALIVSEPLEGKQYVPKHSGAFFVEKDDWVQFSRLDDGTFAIWKKGAMFSEIYSGQKTEGVDSEVNENLAKLDARRRAYSRATGALKQLMEAEQELRRSMDSDESNVSASDRGQEERLGKDE